MTSPRQGGIITIADYLETNCLEPDAISPLSTLTAGLYCLSRRLDMTFKQPSPSILMRAQGQLQQPLGSPQMASLQTFWAGRELVPKLSTMKLAAWYMSE
jgi:hypothetical protein